MSEQPSPPAQQQQQKWQSTETTPQPLPEPAEAQAPPDRVRAGLESALSAERKKRQEMESQLKSLMAAEDERKRQALAEQGRYQDLYTEAEAARVAALERLQALETAEAARLEKLQQQVSERLEKLPDQFRALVPDGLQIDALNAHISRLEQLSSSEPLTPFSTGTLKSNPKADPIPPEAVEEAAKYGYTDARVYFERVYSPRLKRRTK